MSTSATSPLELAEKPRHNRWLEYMGEDDASLLADRLRTETPRAEPSSPTALDRVERLLNHLEARSMELAKYSYAHAPQPSRPAWNKLSLAALMLALWLGVVASFFVYVRLANGKRTPGQDPLTGQRIISPMSPGDERNVAGSFHHLAKTVASSSKKLSRLEAELERSKKGLRSMASPAAAEFPDAATTSIALPAGSPLPLGDLAIAHKNPEGIVDYWLMPRGPRGTSAKVVCVGKVSRGVVVRNLEDNRYYTLSQAGEWRAIRKRF